MNEMEIAKIEEDYKIIFHDITFNNIFFKEIFDFINVIQFLIFIFDKSYLFYLKKIKLIKAK